MSVYICGYIYVSVCVRYIYVGMSASVCVCMCVKVRRTLYTVHIFILSYTVRRIYICTFIFVCGVIVCLVVHASLGCA